MTIKNKYLELRKKNLWIEKIIDTCSPTLKTDQNLAHTSRCLKEEKSHKMCWIFHETLPIWLPIRCPHKNCVCLMKSLKNMSENLETMTDFVRLRPLFWKYLITAAMFDHVLICLLINTSAPSHWFKSVAWPVGPVLKFRDIPDWLKTHQLTLQYGSTIKTHISP